ncbi:hypothetical protein CONCODRAFT_6680 [Conidiobolus coronatus NRRL 28638]|uniref:DASH complex subunit DAM1 n=1 Tax=Conidiobolus coronatus (strain ATCC 28846 / CBS 209.66 / NRRL 28638) TaxID=796925 RepID=A0A137P706_CONC2|nr:hypothetical protein CONCODRAFT_6680 [Conidiobolus coronatus NRRL 28638]|eukprot:KXN70749.1 hypothetical protein CONCODRAFT_6680 [Conidiobolus coronatus NRRL 28638]
MSDLSSITPYRRRSVNAKVEEATSIQQLTLDLLKQPIQELFQGTEKLKKNMVKLNKINSNLVRLNSNFSQFLNGLNMNQTVAHFPEAPVKSSFNNIDINELFHSRIVTPNNAFNMDYQLEQLNINEHEPEPETLPEPEPQPEKQTTSKRPMKGTTAANKRLRRPKKPDLFTITIIETLPIKFRQDPHKANIDIILQNLRKYHQEGLYEQDIGDLMDVKRHQCKEYLNALVRTKHVLKESKKGLLYRLNPEKHPFSK